MCCPIGSLKANGSSSSPAGIRPPSRRTPDPCNSSFIAALNETRKGRFVASPTRVSASTPSMSRANLHQAKTIRRIPEVVSARQIENPGLCTR
jgi:hypothetical protein